MQGMYIVTQMFAPGLEENYFKVHSDLVCTTVQCVHIKPRNKKVSFKVCTV